METFPKWVASGYVVCFALLPWSTEYSFGQWSMVVPAEPIIAVLGAGLLFWLLQRPLAFWGLFTDRLFLKTSTAWIIWMAISAYFSSLPLVSWKYWLVSAGHWWVFAVGFSVWPGLWQRAVNWFAFSMIGVAIYTLVHHATYSFREDQAILAPKPFFHDHTLWAATLAMLLFLPIQPIFKQIRGQKILFTLALLISTCRAGLLSVLTSGILAASIYWKQNLASKVRVRKFLPLLALLLVFATGFAFHGKIGEKLHRDVSWMERLNRWHCAARMAQEKPLFGFGPGTYQFQYIRFQQDSDLTRISLQEPLREDNPSTFGRGGGAHSEYWQALAETGWPGLLLWLALAGLVLFQVAYPAGDFKTDWPQILTALALFSFFTHGLVNNFLHDGRMAALVWGGMAWLFSRERPHRVPNTP